MRTDARANIRFTLHYSPLDRLDATAEAAGLTLASRWHDWTGTPSCPDSTDPVSGYHQTKHR